MAATALAGAFAAGSAQAAPRSPFAGETVFGDSLSDGGNLSILQGSPTIMRFTTNPGLTAVEGVAAYYGLTLTPSLQGGTNFAYGGAGVNTNAPSTAAGVPTLTQQVTRYLAANPTLRSNELYTVFGGANDIFYHATAAAVGDFVAAHSAGLNAGQIASLTALAEGAEGVTTTETAAQAAANVTGAAAQELTLIASLQKAGARYILVFNLPDIGRTPEAAAEEALAPGTKARLTSLSQGFDSVLNAGLASTRVGIIPVNTYALLNELQANPSAYGFVNATTPACTTSSSLNCTPATLVNPTAAMNYIFADGVHPTTATHALFAQVVESEIIAPQQISIIAEQPLATLDSERNAVSQQLLDDQVSRAVGLRLFANGGYTGQHVDGEAFTPSMHVDDGLITVGVDDRLSAALSLGAELTGATASAGLNGQLRRFDIDAVTGSVFGQYVVGHGYVRAQAGFGSLAVHGIDRAFALGQATRGETGKTDGETSDVSVGGGYWFGGPALRLGPFVSAAYERVHLRAYAESGGDSTAMTFGSQTREAMIFEVGARLQGRLPTAYAVLHPYAEFGYADDGDARTREVVAGLTTMNGQFAIPGFTPDRQWAEAKAGVSADLGPHWSAFIA